MDEAWLLVLCGAPFLASPLPRRRGIRINPQAAPVLARVGFRGRELSRLVVLGIAPSETVGDHFHVDEPIVKIDAPHFPLVAVDVDHLDADGLPGFAQKRLFAQKLGRLHKNAIGTGVTMARLRARRLLGGLEQTFRRASRLPGISRGQLRRSASNTGCGRLGSK
jgi:hypothetical protein